MMLNKPALLDLVGVQPRLAVLGLILALAAMPAIAQVPTGSVQGHVFCGDGNVPARDANVQLVPLSSLLPQDNGVKPAVGQPPGNATDVYGNYVIPSVPVGTYVVYVSKPGYSSDYQLVSKVISRFTLDERKKLLAEFPQVTIEAGSISTENVVIHRGGAIVGHVTFDTGGIPGQTTVIATMVSSDVFGSIDGGDGREPLDFVFGGNTDDRGAYRIAGLPAGKYRIGVRLIEEYYHMFFWDGKIAVRPTRTGTGTLTVYAPDAITENDAKLVEVGDGDELTGIDITIPMSQLHSIGGVVTQGAASVAGADLIIMRGGKSLGGSDAVSMSDGSYRFDLLPAGTYTIQAKYRDPALSSGPSITQKLTVQLMDNDILDANIDLPTTVQTK